MGRALELLIISGTGIGTQIQNLRNSGLRPGLKSKKIRHPGLGPGIEKISGTGTGTVRDERDSRGFREAQEDPGLGPGLKIRKSGILDRDAEVQDSTIRDCPGD